MKRKTMTTRKDIRDSAFWRLNYPHFTAELGALGRTTRLAFGAFTDKVPSISD
jgi:hypothetical protein